MPTVLEYMELCMSEYDDKPRDYFSWMHIFFSKGFERNELANFKRFYWFGRLALFNAYVKCMESKKCVRRNNNFSQFTQNSVFVGRSAIV